MKGISSIDLYAVVKEINSLKSSKIEKIFHPREDVLLLSLYKKEFGKQLIRVIMGKTLYVTKFKKQHNQFPSHFCMFLRKYLRNAILVNVVQKKNDRIIEFSFSTKEGERRLIFELFGVGNFILTDNKYQILAINKVQKIKDRILIVHKIYEPPRDSINALSLNSLVLRRVLQLNPEKEVVKILAKELKLGGKYAEEILKRANVEKNILIKEISNEKFAQISKEVENLIRDLKFKKFEPVEVLKENEVIDYAPFNLEIFKELKVSKVMSFNQALEDYYTTNLEKEYITEALSGKIKQEKKLKKRLLKQEEKVEELEQKSNNSRTQGKDIFSQIPIFEKIQKTIKTALEAGIHPQEIAQKIQKDKEKGNSLANRVEYFDVITKKVKIKEPPFLMDLYESVGSQASKQFQVAKKAETKISSAKEHIKKTIDKIEKTDEISIENKTFVEKKKKEKRKWFEKFKYFKTNYDNLFICGRDANQNEEIVKKIMKEKDIIFHADLIGSPFGVLILEGKKPEIEELEECSIFTITHSRAFKQGLSNSDVYWVNSNQVQKETVANKGSFIITGKRNYYKNQDLKIAIGLDANGLLISSPEKTMSKKVKNYIVLKPGHLKPKEVVLKISEKFDLKNFFDEILGKLPTGEYVFCKKDENFNTFNEIGDDKNSENIIERKMEDEEILKDNFETVEIDKDFKDEGEVEIEDNKVDETFEKDVEKNDEKSKNELKDDNDKGFEGESETEDDKNLGESKELLEDNNDLKEFEDNENVKKNDLVKELEKDDENLVGEFDFTSDEEDFNDSNF